MSTAIGLTQVVSLLHLYDLTNDEQLRKAVPRSLLPVFLQDAPGTAKP